MLVPGLSSYGFTYDNWGANPSLTLGTSVTPGATNAEGSYTQIATGANISRDCYWVEFLIVAGSTSTAQKDHLLDIGVDNAGGTSYTTVISNIVCGASAPNNAGSGGLRFVFPLFIKSGSSVAVRIQGNNGTAGTVRVAAKFFGDPSNPEAVPIGCFAETIGTITNSGGVSFTPGNAADGSWVSLGTTTSALWWWQLCVQLSSAAMTGNLITYVDLAFGDATNKVIIQREMFVQTSLESVGPCVVSNLAFPAGYRPVPGGSTIYVRGRCSAAPDSGWNAVAVGIGG